MSKAFLFGIIFLFLFVLNSCSTSNEDENEPQQATLYDRLGGEPAVTAVVEKFTEEVGKDARINCQFATTNFDRFKRLLSQHLCLITGGGCRYTGRDMVTIHKGMGITNADFTALVEDLIAALNFFSVPEQEKTELLETLGGLKGTIVEKKDSETHQCLPEPT